MTRFVQLQEKYENEKASDQTYWANLHGMVDNIRCNFAHYLGVLPDQKVFVDGAEITVVSAGVMNDRGQFERWAVDKLPRSERSITFALRLAYGSESTQCVEPSKAFNLKMRSVGDTYFVKVDGFPEEFKGPTFDPLYEALFKQAISKIGSV